MEKDGFALLIRLSPFDLEFLSLISLDTCEFSCTPFIFISRFMYLLYTPKKRLTNGIWPRQDKYDPKNDRTFYSRGNESSRLGLANRANPPRPKSFSGQHGPLNFWSNIWVGPNFALKFIIHGKALPTRKHDRISRQLVRDLSQNVYFFYWNSNISQRKHARMRIIWIRNLESVAVDRSG